MGQTKIEWTATTAPDGTLLPGYTANFWQGCCKVSAGCQHCYAETRAKRWGHGNWGPGALRVLSVGVWQDVHRWEKEAAASGIRRRVFTSSLADFWEGPETAQNPEAYQVIVDARDRVFREVIPATPHLDWLILTKRPENILRFCPEAWRGGFPANVWIGTSVEDQKAADTRIPLLLQVPAHVRFLSCEPLLGSVDLNAMSRTIKAGPEEITEEDDMLGPPLGGIDGIGWVIVGGESGPDARPMHPEWARSLQRQCANASVAFFFKQHGEYVPTIGSEALGDLQFRSDGVITGKISEMVFPSNPAVKEARRVAAAEIGPNEFGVSRDEIPIGVTTKMTVPHDERLGSYTYIRRVGKHAAGHLLDGREWSEFPDAN